MNPQEEYFLRHSINAPLIKVCDPFSYLIFRANRTWKSSWIVFHINKIQKQIYHPCYFDFTFLRPTHNGGDKSNCMHIESRREQVGFDDYELALLAQCGNLNGLDPIIDLAEAKMATWEMFLYCNDYRLSEIPIRLKSFLWDSINTDLSIEQRMKSQEKVIAALSVDHVLYPRWNSMSQYYDPLSYASWYVKVINSVRYNTSYKSSFLDIRAIA